MRRPVALALTAAFLGLPLGACGGDDEDGNDSPPGDGAAEQQPREDRASSGNGAGGEATTAGDGGEAPAGGDPAQPGIYLGVQRGVATGYIAFGVPQRLPSRLEVGGDATVVGVRWDGWGGRSATGTGSVRVNTCVPTCADGKIERRPGARAVVGDLREGTCGGDSGRFYTRATLRFPPGLGLPARRTVVLFPRCREES